MFVNGDGLLNNDNILWKSSTVEDVKDVMAIKPSNMGEIGTKEEMSPPRSLSRKCHASGGRENGKAIN
jgi:hypothetical protein